MNATEKKRKKLKQQSVFQVESRGFCVQCRKPQMKCYCCLLEPFQSKPRIVILYHPLERRKKMTTGRMTHLCLSNSFLFSGVDFTHHQRLNELLEEYKNKTFILMPRADAFNLDEPAKGEEWRNKVSSSLVILLDGTWRNVKKMFRESKNLHFLPALAFKNPPISQIKVKKQPMEYCLTTLEATASVLQWSGEERFIRLKNVFESVVADQVEYKKKSFKSRHLRD